MLGAEQVLFVYFEGTICKIHSFVSFYCVQKERISKIRSNNFSFH